MGQLGNVFGAPDVLQKIASNPQTVRGRIITAAHPNNPTHPTSPTNPNPNANPHPNPNTDLSPDP